MRVLIAGGGIAGLTAAAALQRAGADAQVFDANADVAQAARGAAVHLWSHAMVTLGRVGLADAVRANSADMDISEFRAADGAMLASWPLGTWAQQIGQPTIGITRPDLHRALAGALAPETLHLGCELVSLHDDGATVTASFADGREERGDVLLGADGARSQVRELLFPGVALRYDESVWRTVLDFEDPRSPCGVFRALHGAGARFMYYHTGPNTLLWLASREGGDRDVEAAGGVKPFLLETFRDFAAPTTEMIEASDERAINRADISALAPLASWTRGRVGLIGDAAHAMTINAGQGACMAVEDAGVVAAWLLAEPDPVLALQGYERARRPRVTELAKLSERIGKMNRWKRRPAVLLRDQIMRRTFGIAARNFRQTLGFDAIAESSAPVSGAGR